MGLSNAKLYPLQYLFVLSCVVIRVRYWAMMVHRCAVVSETIQIIPISKSNFD